MSLLPKSPTSKQLLEEERQHDIELQTYINSKCMRVKLTLEKTMYDIDYIHGERQDGIKHTVAFTSGKFYTWRLSNARKKLIKEIEMITGRQVIIVLDF